MFDLNIPVPMYYDQRHSSANGALAKDGKTAETEKRRIHTQPHNNYSDRESSDSALVFYDARNGRYDEDDMADKRYSYSYSDCVVPAQVRVRDPRAEERGHVAPV